jgi:hypothetical protein
VPDGEADLAGGGDEGVVLVDPQRPAGDEVVDADQGQHHGDREEAVVHEDGIVAVLHGPQRRAGGGAGEVEVPGDPPPPDVGERVGTDQAAGVEVGGERVAVLLGGRLGHDGRG